VANKTLSELREELLAKPGAREAYEDQAPEYAIARATIADRLHSEPTAHARRSRTARRSRREGPPGL
jgi:hypothetical protein